jgi:hypothetical protein
MLSKVSLAGLLCGVDQPDKGLVAGIGQKILAAKPGDSAQAVDAICELFDATLPTPKKALLVEAFDKGGGIAALSTPDGSSKALAGPIRLIFGAPEFQLC